MLWHSHFKLFPGFTYIGGRTLSARIFINNRGNKRNWEFVFKREQILNIFWKISYATVPKKPINIKLPFLGPQTYIAKRKLSALITKFYSHVSIRFIITPSLTVQNLFSFKDKLPITLVSSVICKYSCGQCSATYIVHVKPGKNWKWECHNTRVYLFELAIC